jgi:hypothetical protein
MTAIPATDGECEGRRFGAWRCGECGCVHVRAGGTLLTFTPAEFRRFAESIVGCYAEQEIRAALAALPAAVETVH